MAAIKMTEQLEYKNIFDAIDDDKEDANAMKRSADLRIEQREFCQRLTDGTGITFRISDDTCDPVGQGEFWYWITSFANGFDLYVSNSIDEVFHGGLENESALIAKINELEDMV